MKHGKQPERRTFLQDRLEILIKKQKKGIASFNELTELDEMVNSNPAIRNRIIREDMLIQDTDLFDDALGNNEKEEITAVSLVKKQSLLHRIKALIASAFNLHTSAIKVDMLAVQTTIKGYKYLLIL